LKTEALPKTALRELKVAKGGPVISFGAIA